MSLDPAPRSTTVAQDLRMLTALLASCDPCGFVAEGRSPSVYAGIAGEVRAGLRAGDEVADIVMCLPADADAAKALRLARVAVDWWDNSLEADRRTLALAAS